MEDDEKFTLRDKMALEILSLLATKDQGISCFRDYLIYSVMVTQTNQELSRDYAKYSMDTMRGAYRLADMMRKVRLETFS